MWLPHWPLQRVCFVQPELRERPIVLGAPAASSGRGTGWLVAHCSRAAVAQGVRPGMPLAEARSLWERPGSRAVSRVAHFAQHDSLADRKLLEQLAGWCLRYSPLVGIEQTEEPAAIFLDLTGCVHLFGGEEALALRLAGDFENAGYLVHVAVADTMGAALAAARFAVTDRRHKPGSRPAPPKPLIVPPGGQAALLRNLPVEALRLPGPTIETLHELGLRQIGDLQALPRGSLPSRLGPGVLERLDQALGTTPEPIVALRPSEPVEAHWSFEEPTTDRRTFETVVKQLLGEAAAALAARQEGAQRLICRFLCSGSDSVSLMIGSVRPTAAVEHLAELVRLQLEQLTLSREVLGIDVEIVASGPLEIRQHEIFGAERDRDGARHLDALLDRLSSRLGEKSVLRARLHPDPQPEYASRLDPVIAGAPLPFPGIPVSVSGDSVPDYALLTGASIRPLCLKSRPVPIEVISVVPDGPPERFRWRETEHVVLYSWGPERIDTAWWRGTHSQRDYYRIETTAGLGFWLFRENETGPWFLHGVFE